AGQLQLGVGGDVAVGDAGVALLGQYGAVRSGQQRTERRVAVFAGGGGQVQGAAQEALVVGGHSCSLREATAASACQAVSGRAVVAGSPSDGSSTTASAPGSRSSARSARSWWGVPPPACPSGAVSGVSARGTAEAGTRPG